MTDTACGKNRLPFPSTAGEDKIACELKAWELFESSCSGCATNTCIDQLYQQYLDTRADCAELE